jgi:hypothetical protein
MFLQLHGGVPRNPDNPLIIFLPAAGQCRDQPRSV